MRIQHNIMAMNAYRNYTNNVSAMKANLEKLSSGYKINRAGDDAAGLAISEKMRAQITGLQTAQKNAKDGISLVQTAEGALTEVHDMLNRMVELATQSANGTYDNDVDRFQLQKEMDQLNSEINRIADSANFNGIKLLDGSMNGNSTAKADALAAADEALAAAEAAMADAANATADPVFGEEKELTLPDQAANNKPTGVKQTILETDYKASGKPGFSLTMDGVSHVFNDPTSEAVTTPGTDCVSIDIKGAQTVTIKLSEKDIADAYKEINKTDAAKGDTASAEVIAKAIENKINNNGVGGTPTKGQLTGLESTTASDNNVYTAKADGDKVVFDIKGEAKENVPHYDVKLTGLDAADVAAKGATYTTSKLTAGQGSETNHQATITVKIGEEDVTFKTADTTAASTAAQWATAMGAATAKIDGKDVTLSDYFKVSAVDISDAQDNSEFAIAFEDVTAGAESSGNTISSVAFTGTTTPAAFADNKIATAEGYDAFESGTTGYLHTGSITTIQAGTPEIDQLASTVITLKNTDVVDGAALRLGDQTYVFSIGPDSKYKDAENVVRVDDLVKGTDKDYTEADGKITLTADGLEKVLDKLAEVASNNETFSVGHRETSGDISLKQLSAVKDTTDMSTMDNLKSYIGLTSVDDEATAAAKDAAVADATDAAQKLLDDANAMKAAAEAMMDGKSLTLQIGDTADSYNQLKVDIQDMHAASLGLDKISIADQDSAAKAIDAIKKAINTVSDVRGTLGATQNRLDHTINNLSVMTENIQDAESTIRDVDIAEEMMAYTKNNILIQSAQAMLAQANQVPQGVLQLLQ